MARDGREVREKGQRMDGGLREFVERTVIKVQNRREGRGGKVEREGIGRDREGQRWDTYSWDTDDSTKYIA